MLLLNTIPRYMVVLLMLVTVPLVISAEELSLARAEQSAIDSDPLLDGFKARADAYREQSIAEDTLPDPKLKLGLMNFPTDDFSRDDSPMTQVQIGVQQKFPRGNTLAIKSRRALDQSDAELARAQNQQRLILRELRKAWLDAYYWSQASGIVGQNRILFAQLVDITQSRYTAGKRNQQDVIRAQLELDKIADRLIMIRTREQAARAELSKWVGLEQSDLPLPAELPELAAINVNKDIETMLGQHPLLHFESARIAASQQTVELARQAYKPGWMLDVTYGFRDGEDPDGSDRPDMLSAMVVMDLPLFTGKRQDRKLSASQYRHRAAINSRDDRKRELLRMWESSYAQWQRLNVRVKFYVTNLQPKATSNAKISLYAYQSDTGDFLDLMRARITALDTNLQMLKLRVERGKAQASLLYLTGEEQ